jgi:phosphoribosylanthranilate isomerase
MAVAIKFCGLTRPEDVAVAAEVGAAYMGLVFYPRSPRSVSFETARALALGAPPGLAKVALTVDPDDALLTALLAAVPIDIVQLHGRESPERVAEISALTGLPVMKAVGVGGPEDLAKLDAYGRVADMLLVDAKPAAAGDLPGGNGLSFDWRLIAGRRWPVPWLLAGGLTPENVAEAVRLTGARQVDLSSGVESAPGVKDAAKMRAFAAALADA